MDAENTTYIHELSGWPKFRWDDEALLASLSNVRHRQGRLIGRMEMLGFDLQVEASLNSLTEEVVKSSEIEGEVLDRDQVRSSLARRLGIEVAGLVPSDRDVDGIVEMMLDATQNYASPLTKERLLGWHAALFPTGRSGMARIAAGEWRTDASGPMQVVSGAYGHEKLHFEAPEAARLDEEMAIFLDWLEREHRIDPVIKAAVGHLWFVTIHPFEDGNGRIARAITDMALARSEKIAQRFYSMSAQIRAERKAYYEALESTQKGDLNITPWVRWFLGCLDRAFSGAESIVGTVIRKARFWEKLSGEQLNERQMKVLNRLLDGFEGNLTSSNWAILTKTSQDTAGRDIDDLVRRGVLVKNPGGGRSTSYSLVEPAETPTAQ
jgi:Fic family protein